MTVEPSWNVAGAIAARIVTGSIHSGVATVAIRLLSRGSTCIAEPKTAPCE